MRSNATTEHSTVNNKKAHMYEFFLLMSIFFIKFCGQLIYLELEGLMYLKFARFYKKVDGWCWVMQGFTRFYKKVAMLGGVSLHTI